MYKIKDNGISPVIATILLVALSIILVSLVSVSVMSAVGSFTPVENKVVGFTVQVNASNNSALITPVSGTDLPFLLSYRVYTNNGHWDKSDAGNITVPMFNSSVTYVNIVGNFTDRITALVFSGKVVVEGGVVVVEPTVTPTPTPTSTYYEVGNASYNSTSDFIDSFNDWYHDYYPNATGNAVIVAGDGMNFVNDLPIIIGNQPITISGDNIDGINTNNFRIIISGGGNFTRAPGYGLPLFIFDVKTTKIEQGTLILDGMGEPATHAAIEVRTGSELSIENGGNIVVKNNFNLNGNGGGIYNEGTITIKNGGSLVVTGNKAFNGGGIYSTGSINGLTSSHVYSNTAPNYPNIYP